MIYALLRAMESWLVEADLYRYLQVFDQVAFRTAGAGLLAFLIVLAFGKPVIRWLTAQKIGDLAQFDVDALNEALQSKKNTPTMGGLLIAGAVLVSILIMADLTQGYVQIALVVLVSFAAIGGADDWLKLTAASRPGGSRQGLHAWEKLLFQLGFAALAGLFVFRAAQSGFAGDEPVLGHVLNLPFQKTYITPIGEVSAGLLFLPLPIFVVLATLLIAGLSNAVNITDGMDGLAGGITAIVSIGLVVLCFISGYEEAARFLLVPYIPAADELAIVAAAMGGACLGFLWFNASPAAVFMGDTGSLTLGAMIAYIALVIRQEVVVLIMCGFVLAEIGSVVLQVGYFKATKGRRIFRCAPYHWHLHMGGWQETKIVARMWILTLILVAIGLASLKLR